jgi:hypothetical protein
MISMDKTTKKREIYSLLTVVLGGIVGAILLTLAMTVYYTTEGTYRATNVVVEPALLPSLRYLDQSGGRGDKSSYVFDKITYSYFNSKTRDFASVNLTQKQYQAFYGLIAGDISVPEEIERKFAGRGVSSLAVVLKNPTHQALYTLMRIEVSPDGDMYRVQLRNNSAADVWVYFQHPHIGEELAKILSEK